MTKKSLVKKFIDDNLMRTQFETYASEMGEHNLQQNADGEYINETVDILWRVWKNATEVAYLKIANDYRKVEYDYFSGEGIAIRCESEAFKITN